MPKYCKDCRWLGNQGCIDKGYSADSLACKAFDPPPITWQEIGQDAQILALMAKLDSDPRFSLNVNDLQLELDRYSLATDSKTGALRIPRGQNGYKDFVDLAQLHAENQAYRDRISYLTIQASRLRRALRTLWESAWAYLRCTYPYKMESCSTQTALEMLVSSYVLAPLSCRLEAVNDLLESLRTVDTNLTNMHFTLKEVQLNLQSAIYAEPGRNLGGRQ